MDKLTFIKSKNNQSQMMNICIVNRSVNITVFCTFQLYKVMLVVGLLVLFRSRTATHMMLGERQGYHHKLTRITQPINNNQNDIAKAKVN